MGFSTKDERETVDGIIAVIHQHLDVIKENKMPKFREKYLPVTGLYQYEL